MSERTQPPGQAPRPGGPPKRRIETQIHRRKKAKAVSPLESEWDNETGLPPEHLRMPADKMDRAPKAR